MSTPTPTPSGPSKGHIWYSKENLLKTPKDNFTIKNMDAVDWTQKNVSKDKLSQNNIDFEKDRNSAYLFTNIDSKDFKDPSKRQYIDGWKEHVAELDENWWNANKEVIEKNVDLANPDYRKELGDKWGLDKYKEALLDGKLGPIHRMHVASLAGGNVTQDKPTDKTQASEEELIEEQEPTDKTQASEEELIEEQEPTFKLKNTDYNLPRKLAADENARRILFAKLSSPLAKAANTSMPQKWFEHRAISKDVTDAQANVYKAATQGSGDNAQFSKLLGVQDKINDATLKHNAGQHELLDKGRQLYDKKLDTFKLNSQKIDNTNQKYLYSKLSYDAISKAEYQDVLGINIKNYIRGLEHNEKVDRQNKLMFEYGDMTNEATRYQDVLNRMSSEPYKANFVKKYKKENEGSEITDEQIERAFKVHTNEVAMKLGFKDMDELSTKATQIKEKINKTSWYLTALPGYVESVPEHKKGGHLLNILKKGGKNPDVSRYEAQIKQSIKTVDQLYELFEKENARISKSFEKQEKEFAKQLKIT